MKAIVTGGAGFIGSHVVELLLDKGYEVLALDNFSNGQKENVVLFKDNPHYSFVEVDLSEPFEEELFKDAEYIFHMAALADIIPSVKNPFKYHRANVNGTILVLEAARKFPPKKFVYCASSSCYGTPDEYPTKEDADIRPEYPYAFTKYIGEEYVLFWGKLYQLPVVSLRYFNVYGTRAKNNATYGAVFKVFLSQKLHGEPLTVVGDGSQTRDFTYVTDVARATLLAAIKPVRDEIINIGTGRPQSVKRLADLISPNQISIPKRPGEPDTTHADATKAKELLGWEPQISFEEGVQMMLSHIEYWRDAPLFTPETIEKATKIWFSTFRRQEKGQ